VRVRGAAVAGSFYPSDPAELAALVDHLLAATPSRPIGAAPIAPIALVAPHAGYRYSGAVAASAYALLIGCAAQVDRVVVLGPAHFVRLTGMAVPRADAFATPLGPVRIDRPGRETAMALPGVTVDDEPHEPEHSLETQLPFLQRLLAPATPVLPVAVGTCPAEQVADLLAALAAPGTLAVVSTDLSHYLDVSSARQRDARTAEAIVARLDAALAPDDVCGFFPLRGLLRFAADRDLVVRLLHLATSADVGADPHRVVGYGAFAVPAR
jgi:AmmeMemoRadiSam system protein B